MALKNYTTLLRITDCGRMDSGPFSRPAINRRYMEGSHYPLHIHGCHLQQQRQTEEQWR